MEGGFCGQGISNPLVLWDPSTGTAANSHDKVWQRVILFVPLGEAGMLCKEIFNIAIILDYK